jgi:hypothetical protein
MAAETWVVLRSWSASALGPMRWAATLGLLAVLVAGCTDYPEKSGGTYHQTWPKPYTRTPYSEWHDDMSFDQQFIATAEIIESAQGGSHRRVRLPPDEVLDEYRKDIGSACTDPTAILYPIALAVYEETLPTFILGLRRTAQTKPVTG